MLSRWNLICSEHLVEVADVAKRVVLLLRWIKL